MIWDRYQQMRRSHWGMNTNIMGAFMEILKLGKSRDVADADMPPILLILLGYGIYACATGDEKRANGCCSGYV